MKAIPQWQPGGVGQRGILQTRTACRSSAVADRSRFRWNNEIVIGRDGSISAVQNTGARNAVNVVGQLKLVNPPEADLVRGGTGSFACAAVSRRRSTRTSRWPAAAAEGSNVNVVEQMVTMISLGRQFEMQTRMLSTAEQNDAAAAKMLGTGDDKDRFSGGFLRHCAVADGTD